MSYLPDRLRNAASPLKIERVKLNAGGYDTDGRYYGGGKPLYRVTADDVDGEEIRAYDRLDAQARIMLYNPSVRFARLEKGARQQAKMMDRAITANDLYRMALYGRIRHGLRNHPKYGR